MRILDKVFFTGRCGAAAEHLSGAKKLIAVSSSPGQLRKPTGHFAAVSVVFLAELGAHARFLGETYQQVKKDDPENQVVQQVQ